MNDYERIARVIRYLDERLTEQPSLADLAQFAGLSEFHFHRLFSTWAGVTPKDFLQCLTVTHVKELLRSGTSVLDAALSVGLSGPGRLHDLCVTLEAASPGELKSGGAGWIITAGMANTPFGLCFLAETPRGICRIEFVDKADDESLFAGLQNDWPQAQLRRDDPAAASLAQKIFNPQIGHGEKLRAFVKGTAFQIQVWRALLQIEPGAVVSYGRLASAVGKPSAARAVGTAIGQNALAYLIPCHRVIRETGVIGDYRWGKVRKQTILAWESCRSEGALKR